MQCSCQSAPDYHRDDCLLFYSDGTIRPHYKIEMEFNQRIEAELNDICPVYFQLKIHSSFFKAYPLCKVTSEDTSVPEYIKLVFNKVSEDFFNETGNSVVL